MLLKQTRVNDFDGNDTLHVCRQGLKDTDSVSQISASTIVTSQWQIEPSENGSLTALAPLVNVRKYDFLTSVR
jgi:hypothetical protein